MLLCVLAGSSFVQGVKYTFDGAGACPRVDVPLEHVSRVPADFRRGDRVYRATLYETEEEAKVRERFPPAAGDVCFFCLPGRPKDGGAASFLPRHCDAAL